MKEARRGVEMIARSLVTRGGKVRRCINGRRKGKQ